MYQNENSIVNDLSKKKNKIIQLKKLQESVTNLDKLEQIEIFRIIQKYDNRLTENKNGIFINLSNLSELCIDDISRFVAYSLDNKKRLNKIEVMSQNILKNSILNQQYKEYNNDYNLKYPENKIPDNLTKDIHNDKNMLSKEITIDKENESPFNSILDIDDIIENISDTEDMDENEEMKNNQLNQIREKVEPIEIINSYDTFRPDQVSRKNKFTGKRARLYKKCRELTKSYQGTTLISFGNFNSDIGDSDFGDEVDDNLLTSINELKEDKI